MLVVTILASTISYIDESVVNVALPTIEAELKTSAAVVQWLVNAYMLSLTALVLVGGAAGDQFGRRRVFVIGTALFAAASLWCGLSGDIAQLITARTLQGAGAALLIPCSLAIIGATFDESERGEAIGTWAAFSAHVGGDRPGARRLDRRSRVVALDFPDQSVHRAAGDPGSRCAMCRRAATRTAARGLDWRGALLALLRARRAGLRADRGARPRLERHAGDRVADCRRAVACGIRVRGERAAAPMMPLALFRSRTFSGVNLLTLLLYAGLGGAIFFLPFLLIQVHGYSATLAGAAFLPFTAIMVVLSRWAGGLLDRFGARLPLIVGPAIAGVGLRAARAARRRAFLSRAARSPMIVLGLGMAITVAPLTTSVINAVPERQAGVASGINNAVASLASLLAIAIFGAVALGAHNTTLERQAVGAAAVGASARRRRGSARKVRRRTDHLQGEERKAAEAIVRQSLGTSISLVMWTGGGARLRGGAVRRADDPAAADAKRRQRRNQAGICRLDQSRLRARLRIRRAAVSGQRARAGQVVTRVLLRIARKHRAAVAVDRRQSPDPNCRHAPDSRCRRESCLSARRPTRHAAAVRSRGIARRSACAPPRRTARR